jgi:hypothetical protein
MRFMTATPTWPTGPSGSYRSDGDYFHEQPGRALLGKEPAHALIGELAGLLRSTRGHMMAAASVLGAIAIGAAVQAGIWAKVLRPSPAGVINLGLMSGFALSWLVAGLLLASAGRPVLDALGELRWRTGSPLDPRAPWLTVPPVGANGEEWSWIRAHLLVGAARLSRYRIQLANTWTFVAAAFFMACTAVFLFGG